MVKLNLTFLIPSLVELIGDLDFPWERIDKSFSQKIEERKIVANGEPIIIEATIYDIIVSAKKGDSTAIGYLHFLNKLFEELTIFLTESEKILIRRNVVNMLTTLDKNYLTFLGEIATLNNLMKTKLYRLTAIEANLPNGKTIDFKLTIIESQKVQLVEVNNIVLNDDKVEVDPVAIEKFFRHRVQQKINEKTINLTNEIDFYLVTVLWGNKNSIRIYSDFFKNNSFFLKNIIEPLSYISYSDNKGYYEHYFGKVSGLFKH